MSPTDVKCPTCHAEPGERCNTKPLSDANRMAGAPGRSHPERFRAAAEAEEAEQS